MGLNVMSPMTSTSLRTQENNSFNIRTVIILQPLLHGMAGDSAIRNGLEEHRVNDPENLV